MKNGINYILSNGLLTENTGAMKICYDFTDTGNYESDGASKIINSIESGNPIYSGQISLNVHPLADSTMTPYADFSLITGEFGINLLGNKFNNTSGLASRIQIFNTEDLYSGNNFTFFIEGGKLPRSVAESVYKAAEPVAIRTSVFTEHFPIHNKEIIFSNIVGEGINYSGWEFGVNGANLFYLRTADVGGQKILTYDKNTPYGENIWAVRHSNRTLTISRYDLELDEIESNEMSLGSSLRNGAGWTINSGANSDLSAINTAQNSAFTSSTRLKKFLYFDEYLSDPAVKSIAKYMNKNVSLNEPYILESGYLYEITGYEEVYFEESGLLYSKSVLSGYETGTYEITGEPVFTYNSGEVTTSGLYYENCDSINGLFITNFETGTGISTLMTGYSISYPSSGYDVLTPVYILSGESGVLSSGIYTGYLQSETYWDTTGYETGIVDFGNENLLSKSCSYLGMRNTDDFVEIYIAANVNSGSEKIVNSAATRIISSYKDGSTLKTNMYNDLSSTGLLLYINGVAMRYGTGTEIAVVEDGQERVSFEIEKDYILTGSQEVFSSLTFTGLDETLNLYGVGDMMTSTYLFKTEGAGTEIANGEWIVYSEGTHDTYINRTNGICSIAYGAGRWWLSSGGVPLYWFTIYDNELPWEDSVYGGWDVENGDSPAPFAVGFQQELLITGLNQYQDMINGEEYGHTYFKEIKASGRDVFFNGVKIYEGIEYNLFSGEYLVPTGYLTGMTGVYFTWPKIDGSLYSTGETVYDVYGTGYIKKDSVATWVNGLRRGVGEYIYHDIQTDLIKGQDLAISFGEGVFKGEEEV